MSGSFSYSARPRIISQTRSRSAGRTGRVSIVARPFAASLPAVSFAERLDEDALLFDRPAALLGQVAERADGRLVGYALYHFTYSSFRTDRQSVVSGKGVDLG